MISSLYNASRSVGMHFIHRGNYNYNNSIKFVSYGLSQTRTPSQRRPYNLTIWFHSTRIVGFEPTHDLNRLTGQQPDPFSHLGIFSNYLTKMPNFTNKYGTIQNVNDEYSTKEYKLCLNRNLPKKEFNKKGGDTMQSLLINLLVTLAGNAIWYFICKYLLK